MNTYFKSCPVCNQPLINQDNYYNKILHLYKYCLNTNHKFEAVYDYNLNNICSISYRNNWNLNYFKWDLLKSNLIYSTISVSQKIFKDISLPFFFPDFSNIKKLNNKLNLSLLFI